jgi:hypothetical protein
VEEVAAVGEEVVAVVAQLSSQEAALPSLP